MGKTGDIVGTAIAALGAIWAVMLYVAIFGGDWVMTWPGFGVVLLWVVGVLLALAFYFLPTIIAALRGIPNALSVAVINLFLGWTLLGWVAALAIAVAGVKIRAAD
ncbi:superinfection immunity protein [Mycobacterium sp. 94-17]|uniref:superinfection immunity protein n=1 Tax=Mycobacterium sp. 94-17 TaxID=2986147 RepID=UPI002D1F24EB|nr:superinfection immunity protein [Mycobacterium sp. 94-17]MEB4212315.1 superinfection immunity protein [Mycobacterium sp. 94-17]